MGIESSFEHERINKMENELSYKSKEIEAMSREQLIELAIGIKPKDYFIGDVQIDGIYPASQLHFHFGYKNHDLVHENKKKFLHAIRQEYFSGFIHAQFVGSRLILTSSCSANERTQWAIRFAEVFDKVLKELKGE
jgi:hypothetical protein